MRREIDISRYFPILMKQIKQFQGIRDGENPEFCTLFQSMEQVLNRAFIEESDEVGIRRWERILHLVSNGDLDVRKFRILARMNEKLPYTMPILKQQLELLCGSDGYTIALNQEQYTLQVRLAFLVSEKLAAVREYLQRIKPANILVQYGLWNPAIVLCERQKLIFHNLSIKASFWNGFGSDSIILNGTRKLDGTWLLDQSVQGIRLHEFGMKAVQENKNSLSACLQKYDNFYLNGSFSLDGSRTLSGGITKEVL